MQPIFFSLLFVELEAGAKAEMREERSLFSAGTSNAYWGVNACRGLSCIL